MDPNTEQIDAYLKGNMSPEERTAFEQEMHRNEALAALVNEQRLLMEGIKYHHRNRLVDILKEEEQLIVQEENEKESKSKIVPLWQRPLVIAIAASVLVLVLIRLIFSPGTVNPEKVYAQFAEHYTSDLVQRDIQMDCMQVQEAALAYNQQKYGEAIGPLDVLRKNSEVMETCKIDRKEVELLLGISLLNTNEIEQSRDLLRQLVEESETARWNYILSFVKTGEIETALKEIGNWENPSNYYLKRLDGLKKALN